MRLLYILITCFYIVVLFTACNPQPEAPALLNKAEAMMDNNPDSAMLLIDSIFAPKASLSRAEYMQYLMARVQAKYKTYQDISSDTAVLQAVAYFEKRRNNPAMLASAYYLAGCVLREQGEKNRAIDYLKNALTVASQTGNNMQQGLIYENLAYLYHKELLQDQTIDYARKAYGSYRQEAGTETKQINVLSLVAQNFLKNEHPDSALYYANQALAIADSIQNLKYQASVRNSMGVTYQQQHDFARSNLFLKEALLYSPDSVTENKIRLNMADNYLQLNDYHSLNEILPTVKQSLDISDDLYYKSAVLGLLTNYEKRRGNYAQALAYTEEDMQIQSDIFDSNQSKLVIEAENKFDFSKKETEVKLTRQQRQNMTLSFSFLLVSIVGMGLLLRFRAKQKQKIKDMQAEYEKAAQQAENQKMGKRIEQYAVLTNQYKSLVRDTAKLHATIYNTAQAGEITDKTQHFSTIKKELSQTENTIRANMGDFSRAFLAEQNFSSRLAGTKISDADAILLFMLSNRESRKDIAALLATSPHAITLRSLRLKEKLKPILSEAEFLLFFS